MFDNTTGDVKISSNHFHMQILRCLDFMSWNGQERVYEVSFD